MYNIATVQGAFMGLVGFRQHDDPEIEENIAAELLISRSGLFIDNAHPLVTAGNLYRSVLQLTTGADNGTTTPLSDLIKRTELDAISSVLTALRTRKLLRLEGKLLLSETVLFEGEGSIADIIQPQGRFVGLLISTRDADVAIRITKLGLQFTSPVANLPIHVFTPFQETSIASATATTASAGRMQWSAVDLTLSGSTSYLVGYYETDLPVGVQAVRWNNRIGHVACAGCSPVNARIFDRWRNIITVTGARMDIAGVFDEWDSQNYGLNLAVAVGCDIGPVLIAQQSVIAGAIQQQCVVSLLNQIAYTPRITVTEQQVRDRAMFALQNTELPKLERILNALDIDLSGLSDKCLPDTQGMEKVTRGTVFRR